MEMLASCFKQASSLRWPDPQRTESANTGKDDDAVVDQVAGVDLNGVNVDVFFVRVGVFAEGIFFHVGCAGANGLLRVARLLAGGRHRAHLHNASHTHRVSSREL